MFALSKYFTVKYKKLSFNVKIDDDAINSLAFELVNACFNSTDKIKTLYEYINQVNIEKFQQALENAICFVIESLQSITKFKANTRKGNKIFHSKFQILSMIAATFKAMYTNQDFSCECEGWKNKEEILQNNLWRYYIYDILTNYWSDGGTSKIYSTDRYFNTIKDSRWIVAIDGYFESSIAKKENNKIKSVSSEDYVFLNCIYLDIFTTKDQLSVDKFDVEHIAPKAQMKKLIQKTHCDGLPISCIANLCYLPEHNNRSKGDKNFYQDTNYNGIVNLNEIEEKFSFTVKEDLDWMNKQYGAKDAEVLTNCYHVHEFKKKIN